MHMQAAQVRHAVIQGGWAEGWAGGRAGESGRERGSGSGAGAAVYARPAVELVEGGENPLDLSRGEPVVNLLRVAARDLEQYDGIHRDCLARLPGVSAMRTSFSLRRIKQMQGYPVRPNP